MQPPCHCYTHAYSGQHRGCQGESLTSASSRQAPRAAHRTSNTPHHPPKPSPTPPRSSPFQHHQHNHRHTASSSSTRHVHHPNGHPISNLPIRLSMPYQKAWRSPGSDVSLHTTVKPKAIGQPSSRRQASSPPTHPLPSPPSPPQHSRKQYIPSPRGRRFRNHWGIRRFSCVRMARGTVGARTSAVIWRSHYGTS